MDIDEVLIELKKEISELRKELQPNTATQVVSERWVPRSVVMKFLNYGDTQMASLEKSNKLVVTKIGKRKFILRDSLNALLDKNALSNEWKSKMSVLP